MGFYNLPKQERQQLVEKITKNITFDLTNDVSQHLITYFSDEDTYIRKSAYLAIGIAYAARNDLRRKILLRLALLLESKEAKVRQTVINAAGEIGIKDFEIVSDFFEKGLFDGHHFVRNAVIGSIKKMGSKNPLPVLK